MMRPTEIWSKDLRIIEVGATNGAIGERLVAAGFDKYLAVTATRKAGQSIASRSPRLRGRVVAALPINDVQQNNADVLVLDSWAALAVSRIRWVRHAKYVAVKLQPTPLCWISLLMACVQCLIYRFAWPRVVDLGRSGSGPWLVEFQVRKPRPHNGVRRFIPHHQGIESVLRRLESAGVRHAVLRWFENLPELPIGEDIDLLVDDASLQQVRAILDEGPGIQPVDLYSVTGLPGADFRSMPYYPPYLADELLDRAVDLRGICSVPAAREHFLSLAYHALYHKGTASGIPINEKSAPGKPSAGHDYVTILRRLADRLGIRVSITLEGLDSYLDSQGWRPPHDMLIRLSRRNRWVKSLLQRHDASSTADDRVAVFLVREEALRRGGVERAVKFIEGFGFQITATHTFDERSVPTIARSLRGGNWGRGPWPVSGGPPVAAIVAYDPAPIVPTRKHKKRFPFIANARLLCKEQLRDAFNEGLGKDQHCNVIHSSDNGREAMDYLRIIMPHDVDALLQAANLQPVARAA
jgi:hypothetical protein